jgi:hypothetical protein
LPDLVILAAAIPFVIIVLVVAVLATVSYTITKSRVRVAILGLTLRNIPLSDITSVEYLPPVPGKGMSLLHQGGAVVLNLASGKSSVITPRDAEGFAEDLQDAVYKIAGKH